MEQSLKVAACEFEREGFYMSGLDFHIHSCYSDDGEFTVLNLIDLCNVAGIRHMAITDHNSVRAVPKLLDIAPKMGISAISGVELDCVHEGKNLHLLGYQFDHTNPVFSQIEQDILKQEKAAAIKKLELIGGEFDFPIDTEEILAASHNGIVTGELIAEILLKQEEAKDFRALLPYRPGGERSDNPYVNFYWDYFSQGKPAHVPIRYISLSEAVALIHESGGRAVLAHPGQNLRGDFTFLKKIVACGIDGIEAYSSYHSKDDARFFAEAAKQNTLMITCGSDFHGKTKPAIMLGGHGADESIFQAPFSCANWLL